MTEAIRTGDVAEGVNTASGIDIRLAVSTGGRILRMSEPLDRQAGRHISLVGAAHVGLGILYAC
ncbi:MAG: hypothetical protein PVH30_10245 [Desulfobacterales bacterium]|jgi:hypothetical protein